MVTPSSPAYGTSRERRPDVSYAQIERAATAILKTGERPTVEGVREAIGGSPKSILEGLRRYWRTLGTRVDENPASLARIPAEIADLAEELWQRSLALAAQSAAHDDNAARERLEQIKRENELRAHDLATKERMLREREEQRDKTMAELREQVATLLSLVSRNAATIAALQAGKAEAELRAENYRHRLATLISRAVVKNQNAAQSPSTRRAALKQRRPLKREAPRRGAVPSTRARRKIATAKKRPMAQKRKLKIPRR